jgi:hypothetical protein
MTLGRYNVVCHPCQEGHHHAKRFATLPVNLRGKLRIENRTKEVGCESTQTEKNKASD